MSFYDPRHLTAVLLMALALCVARVDAQMAPAPVEMITVPKAEFTKMVESYKEQRAANIVLFRELEEAEAKHKDWQVSTNCS